jgi:hypothetical protein
MQLVTVDATGVESPGVAGDTCWVPAVYANATFAPEQMTAVETKIGIMIVKLCMVYSASAVGCLDRIEKALSFGALGRASFDIRRCACPFAH